jgi:putative serine protease PepD
VAKGAFVDQSPNQTGGRRRGARWLAALAALLAAGLVGGLIANTLDSDNGDDGTTSAGSGASTCNVPTIADERLPAVVTILVGGRGAGGVGSGEVIRADGYILTNDHVIAPAGGGGEVTIRFADGQSAPARIAGRDPRSDLAVLHISGRTGLPTIPIGDSATLRVGQPVVALGSPLGLSSSVTSGIVSALGRTLRLPNEEGIRAFVVDGIQTDAAINPGNSGGALVDCSGALVGVPTAGASVPSPGGGSSAGSIGLGFAIPVNYAKRIAQELISTGSVSHAYLGLEAQPVAQPGQGLLVVGVLPGGPAAAAGLREGDLIVSVDGEPAVNPDQLAALTLTKRAGEQVELEVERAGSRTSATVTLGAAP